MTIKRLGQGLRGSYAPPLQPEALVRLQSAWSYLVGPLIAKKTRPIELRGSKLVVGCWDLASLSSLQASSTQSWPQLRDRFQTHTGLGITSMVIIPSDPLVPRINVSPDEDHFKASLRFLRQRASDFTRS